MRRAILAATFAICAALSACTTPGAVGTNYVMQTAPTTKRTWLGFDCENVQPQYRTACIDDNRDREVSRPVVIAYSAEQNDAANQATDSYLASHLKDPLSAMQYSTSNVISCNRLVVAADEMPCICYEVNAKNSYGGYIGSKLSVLMMLTEQPPYVGIEVKEDRLFGDTPTKCSASMTLRDAANIRNLVSR